MRIKRIFRGVLLSLSLLVFFSVSTEVIGFAKEIPRISVSETEAKAGETVDITVSLENNPGIVSATLKISFDSDALTLKKVKDEGVFGAQSHKPELTSPYTLAWANDTATKNYTVNGVIATLTFSVNDSAEKGKSYPIELTYDYDNYDIYDKDLNLIKFDINNGLIRVSKSGDSTDSEPTTQGGRIGDVNMDGKLNIKDATLIHKYIARIVSLSDEQLSAADVNKDDKVNVKDASVIQKAIAMIIELE